MKRLSAFFFAAVLLVSSSSVAHAHSGGTDSRGCHAGTQPYHCHTPKSDDRKTWETVGYVAAGLAGVALLLWVWKGRSGIAIQPTDPGLRFTPAHKDQVGAFLEWRF